MIGLAFMVGRPNTLEAGTGPGSGFEDTDKDGLTNTQELVLGTNPCAPDSDSDTFSDLEEIARGSSPTDNAETPASGSVAISMYARTESGVITVGSALYVASGSLASAGYRFGVVYQGRQIRIPMKAYLNATRVQLFLGEGNSKLALLETSFPERIVNNLGAISPYATVVGSAGQTIAATANLVSVGGTVMNVTNSSSGGSGGLIYQPLVPTSQAPPNTSSKGQVCYQSTTVVGTNGSSLVQEVDSAGCEPLPGFCASADCADSVGSTVEIADPGALIGG